ncbi:MAG: Na+:solute symporter [Aureliella sp.]
MQLTALDWVVIATYFVITIGIGLWFSRKASESMADYFVSGRSLPWWLAGTSMVATTFAADTPLAVTGMVAKNGLAGNWVWWSLAMGGMVTVFVYAKLWRRAEVMTDVELTEMRYSGRPASALRLIRAVYVALIINPIIIGWVTGAMLAVLQGTVLSTPGGESTSSGMLDWMIIVGCLAVVGVYCTFSGLWGVAFADVLQFFAAMIGCSLLAYFAVQHVGGMDALHAKVVESYGSDQAFRFLPDVTAEDAWLPLHAFLVFLLVQWWATWYPGAEPGGGGYVVQRMAACQDERHATLATLWYQVAHYCVRPWPWILVAFVSLAMYPELRERALDSSLGRADVGFAWVMRDVSPVGVRGLMLVTFFAAFMSTISTQMNWGASYLTRDVYQRFVNPTATDDQLVRASRWLSVLVLVTGAAASWIMKDIDIDDVWRIMLALGAGSGAVYMLRWFWWRINAWSEISAMLGSLVYFLLVQYLLPDLGSEMQLLCVAGATILTWLVVTFITRPDDAATLTSFYRKVQPAGPGWSAVAKQNTDIHPSDNLGISLLCALAGSAMIYFTIPAIGSLLFGDFSKFAILLGGAIASGIVLRVLMGRK